jgi:hypothetical protein
VTTTKNFGKAPTAGILQHKVFGLPVDRGVMFSNHKDVYKPRIEKRQQKLMAKISFVRHFLEPDEIILLVAKGHSPLTVLEKVGIGWFFLYLKRSLLIFTDRRIFHVPTTPGYGYRNSIAQIRYAACESIEIKRTSLVVKFKGGNTTEKFFRISGRERKKIKELLKGVDFEGTKSDASGRMHLCPQCAAPLYHWVPNCRGCGLMFKTATVATVLAIVLPGGGYFYLRQVFLGAVTALLEIAAALLIALSVNSMLNGGPWHLLWLGGGTGILVLVKSFAVVHARLMVNDFLPRPAAVTFQASAAAKG